MRMEHSWHLLAGWSTRESHSKHKVRTHSSDTFGEPQFYNVEYSSDGSRKDCIVQWLYTITPSLVVDCCERRQRNSVQCPFRLRKKPRASYFDVITSLRFQAYPVCRHSFISNATCCECHNHFESLYLHLYLQLQDSQELVKKHKLLQPEVLQSL